MAKLEELTEEQLAGLPEDTRKAILSWKDELISARGVIGNLNKKLKGSDGGSGAELELKTPEEINAFIEKREKQKELDSFIKGNPHLEDFKADIEKARDTGLFSSLEEATKFIAEKNPTLMANMKSNQAWIWSNMGSGSNAVTGKVPFETYNQMTTEEQAIYKQNCHKAYEWLTFSDTGTSE